MYGVPYKLDYVTLEYAEVNVIAVSGHMIQVT